MLECEPLLTPIASNEKRSKNDRKKVDELPYRSRVNSLIYLIDTRPDIVHPISVFQDS